MGARYHSRECGTMTQSFSTRQGDGRSSRPLAAGLPREVEDMQRSSAESHKRFGNRARQALSMACSLVHACDLTSLATYFRHLARTKQSNEHTPKDLRMLRSLRAFASNRGVLLMRCHTRLETLHYAKQGWPNQKAPGCTLKNNLEKVNEKASQIC